MTAGNVQAVGRRGDPLGNDADVVAPSLPSNDAPIFKQFTRIRRGGAAT